MHNSLVTHLRGYVEAMFEDIAFAYRQTREKERDKARLLHELEAHGERILTIDLPALCKHLDRCLADEQYAPSRLRLGRCGRRVQVPAFLRDLYLQLFDNTGKLLEESSIDAVAAMRQLLLGCKKIKLPCPFGGIVDEVKTFIQVEKDTRSYSLSWECDELYSESEPDLHFASWIDPLDESYRELSKCSQLLSAVADRISASYGDLSLELPEELPRHGPGVTADLPKNVSKYTFEDWPTKLDRAFPYDYYGTTDLGLAVYEGRRKPPRNREVPSRLIAVPKDLTKPRLIAAEPSQHQWIQQLVRSQLERRLSRTPIAACISFRDQGQNQRFAVEGSRSGCYATIDLSAASDRLSCAVVERFFRKNPTILNRLHACRTRWLEVNIPGISVEYLRLKKFAPMGSAVTFPVQSIVYAGVAVASVLRIRGWKPTTSNIKKAAKMVTVYGDDIIVPVDCCWTTIRLLEFLGLKVNTSKTYWNGKFRESCGVEAFKGLDVTPARVLIPSDRASTSTMVSLIQSSNNFWMKGWWHTAKWLETTFRDYKKLLPIVPPQPRTVGLVSFTGYSTEHLRSRYSKDLHRNEVRAMVPYSRTERLPTGGDFRLFQYFIEDPDPSQTMRLWESGTIGRTVSDMRQGWVDALRISESVEIRT